MEKALRCLFFIDQATCLARMTALEQHWPICQLVGIRLVVGGIMLEQQHMRRGDALEATLAPSTLCIAFTHADTDRVPFGGRYLCGDATVGDDLDAPLGHQHV